MEVELFQNEAYERRSALADDSVGLHRLESTGPDDRPQHTPGTARGEQPVGLAAEDAPKLRLQGGAGDVHVPREMRGEALDQILGDDPADPDGQAERDRRKRDTDQE